MNFKKNLIINIFVSICFSAFFISCSSDNKTWNIANLNNDILSYEYYLDKYPKGEYSNSAKRFIEEIKNTPPPIPEKIIPPVSLWDNTIIDSISLKISISIPQSTKYELRYESTYYKIVTEVLDRIGITVVPQNVEYQTTMIFNLKVKALSSQYYGDYGEASGIFYTGYDSEGVISLRSVGKPPITLTIDKKEPCSKKVYINENKRESELKMLSNPETRLYEIMWIFKKQFWDFFYKVWGPSPLLWIDLQLSSNYELSYSDKWLVPPELSVVYEGDYSKDLKNNLIRASYSKKSETENKALYSLSTGIFHSEPDLEISLVLYRFIRYGAFRLEHIQENNLDLIGLRILKEAGPYAIHATPTLILIADNRKKNGWKVDERIITALESITGKDYKNDIKKWKEWWFYNKKKLVND